MKFTLSKSVKDAINNNKPVLALESTIIASGMPYPQNIEFQNKAERVCANLGVVPATIAIIKGVVGGQAVFAVRRWIMGIGPI